MIRAELLTYFTDRRHGWIRVNLAAFPRAVDFMTGDSFVVDGAAYLEEDCDAPAFMDAHHLDVADIAQVAVADLPTLAAVS